MLTEQEIQNAFIRAVARENGNLNRYARKVRIAYPVLYHLKKGKTGFLRMTVGTLARMFPELKTYFFAEDYPAGFSVAGDNTGAIAQGANAFAVQNNSVRSDDALSRADLESRMLHDKDFTAEERLKFVLWLREKV